MIKLYEHQEKGKQALLKNKKYCLFFEVGTGKTFTALSALCELPKCRVLIVAPKRVLENVWKKDTAYDLSKYDVTYLNYEKIARDANFTKNTYDVIILDEVHKLKGKTTKTSRKFRAVTSKATYVWGLTGTPVANNYADVYNIYKNMNIVEFEMTYDEFVWRYYYTKQMESSSGFKFDILLNVKPFVIDELMTRIGKHSMVKEAKDCIDLPEKRTDLVYIDGMINEKYLELKDGILKTAEYEKTMIPLETINKLHQASNGFFYDDYKIPHEICENKKLKELNEILSDMLEETDRVIIVYQYQYDLEQLKTLKYDWTLDPNEFPNKQILFLQYGQSEGLNLQYCNQMIFYSYDYSFLNYEQMTGRIYRNGQKNNVVYTILISKNTIEEQIWHAIANKKSRDEFLKEVLSLNE
jgi:SNF2 family DNA or RNA helicase